MKYELSAVEILKLLGFDSPEGREFVRRFQETHACTLPKVYAAFLETAVNCPVLGTSDLWVGQMVPLPVEPCRWLYDRLEEAEKAQTGNYLEIGSDYGAGIVVFGIRAEDLDQEDPPVYLQHETNPVTQWDPAYARLSDFLQEVVISALALVNYSTAEEELEELGWTYSDYFMECMEVFEGETEEEASFEEDAEDIEKALRRKGADPTRVKWCSSSYGSRVFCCYDEGRALFYAGQREGEEGNTLYTIARTE